jgi:DNA-binding FadR family transcriptional regulator
LVRRSAAASSPVSPASRSATAWSDPVAAGDANWRLHRRIAEITPNAVLRAFYQHMVDYVQEEGLSTLGLRTGSAARLRVHHDIVTAILRMMSYQIWPSANRTLVTLDCTMSSISCTGR